ncbi:hypothetical protein M9H77_08229 [Catharanthus roseus]|uniref:Uncharacterized protein n=1 Tax=Catharanthus roseus TaxID=4058 RepID=A0ACC0BXG3_CATRO|nr:hypothetical protein M9H77_08229 [Catharanthus roseus]
MKEKRPSHSKMKSLKTLKTLSMLECDKLFFRSKFRVLRANRERSSSNIPDDAKINSIEAAQRNQEASIHNLKKQIGQLVKLVSERTLGTLSSNNKVNQRKHVHAILMRFDKKFLKEENVMVVQEKSCEEKATEEPNKKSVIEAYKPEIPSLAALVRD